MKSTVKKLKRAWLAWQFEAIEGKNRPATKVARKRFREEFAKATDKQGLSLLHWARRLGT